MLPIQYSLRSLTAHKNQSVSTALGIGLVVFLFSGVLMLGTGIRKTLQTSGHDDVVLLMRKGSETEITSIIDLTQVPAILAARAIARRPDGHPDGVAEGVTVLDLERTDGEGIANVQVRGVTDDVFAFRPEIRVIEGRRARPGRDECILGRGLLGRFKGLGPGQRIELNQERSLTVVGVFESAGSSFESEVWADAHVVRTAFASEGFAQSIRARLAHPRALESLARSLREQRSDLNVELESAYYERQAQGSTGFIVGMGIAIAVLFTLGAILGAMITMYAAVSQRRREIGVLRALGFGPASIVLSFMTEALLLSLVGGTLGALASFGLSLVTFSVVSASWQEIVFHLEPSLGGTLGAIVLSLVVGTAGGLLPAIRAARMPMLSALRD